MLAYSAPSARLGAAPPAARAARSQARPQPWRAAQPLRAAAKEAPAAADVEEAVATLRRAAANSSPRGAEVLAAMLALEAAKLDPSGFPELLSGDGARAPGWRLVFASGAKDVLAAQRGAAGGGQYFPLTAVQRRDATNLQFENGVFLGRLAALIFRGPYAWRGRKQDFDFDTLKLRLGPWEQEFKIKNPIDPKTFKPDPKGPFFLFAYADDSLCVARGRSGGLAVWARTSPAWELEQGIL